MFCATFYRKRAYSRVIHLACTCRRRGPRVTIRVWVHDEGFLYRNFERLHGVCRVNTPCFPTHRSAFSSRLMTRIYFPYLNGTRDVPFSSLWLLVMNVFRTIASSSTVSPGGPAPAGAWFTLPRVTPTNNFDRFSGRIEHFGPCDRYQ